MMTTTGFGYSDDPTPSGPPADARERLVRIATDAMRSTPTFHVRTNAEAVVDALIESGLLNDQLEQVGCRWIERRMIDGSVHYVSAGPAWHYVDGMLDGARADGSIIVQKLFRKVVDVPGETP